MTIEEAKNKVVTFARSQIGYHEVGNNLTKYAEESNMDELAYGFSMDGQPWCDFFVDYCFWKSFGFHIGQRMIYQEGRSGGAACMNSASFYRGAGAWYSTPAVGDQVIYAGENHTGLVVEVYSNGSFDAVDGNYSDAVTLRRGLYPSCASGFGRPNWSLVADVDETEPDQEQESEPEPAAQTFAVGDLVLCSATRDYSGMTTLHPLVRNCGPWEIKYLNGDRAVLGRNLSGTNNIMTPVNTSTLTKYSTTSAPATSANYGSVIQATIAEKIAEPVIVNNTGATVHVYGGRRKNVEE